MSSPCPRLLRSFPSATGTQVLDCPLTSPDALCSVSAPAVELTTLPWSIVESAAANASTTIEADSTSDAPAAAARALAATWTAPTVPWAGAILKNCAVKVDPRYLPYSNSEGLLMESGSISVKGLAKCIRDNTPLYRWYSAQWPEVSKAENDTWTHQTCRALVADG